MISAQIDELRERAKVLRQGRWSDGADDARLMEEAADTIWQLRDDLQRANDAVQDTEHDESMAWDRVRKAEAEADKLRELVRDVWHLFTEHGAVNPCDLPVVDAVRDRMRELGVEVDDGSR